MKIQAVVILTVLLGLLACSKETEPTFSQNVTQLEGTWMTDCLSTDTINIRSFTIFTGSTYRSYNENHSTSECKDESPRISYDNRGIFQILAKDGRDSAVAGARKINYTLNNGAKQFDIFRVNSDGSIQFGNTTGENNDLENRPLELSEIVFRKK